jgi:hypothetical protein
MTVGWKWLIGTNAMISGANLTFKLNQYDFYFIFQKDSRLAFIQSKGFISKFGLENSEIDRLWIPLRKEVDEEGQIDLVASAG